MNQSHPNSTDLSRREAIERLYLMGWAQTRIARQVNISLEQLTAELQVIRDGWVQSSLRRVDAAQAQELARIDHLESVAWAAWRRSCQDDETTKAVWTDGAKSRAEKTTRKQTGDGTFLTRVAWCIDKRCEILGLKERLQHKPNATTDHVEVDQAKAAIDQILAAVDEREGASGSETTPDRFAHGTRRRGKSAGSE